MKHKSAIREWLWAVLLFLAICLMAILLLNCLILPYYTRHNSQVEVPEVVELNVAQADSVLAASGFKLVVEREQYDWNYPEGMVIDQNPEAYAITKKGRRVYVTVSIGEKLALMPNLMGKSARDATFTAQAAGLILTDESFGYEYSNYYPAGVVMAQSIPPGTKLKKDTPIHVSVSLGTLPNEFRVPEVVGQSLDRAQKIILTSGLEVGKIAYVFRSDLLPNTVISQIPNAGEKTDQGQLIDLTVSTLQEESIDRQTLGRATRTD